MDVRMRTRKRRKELEKNDEGGEEREGANEKIKVIKGRCSWIERE